MERLRRRTPKSKFDRTLRKAIAHLMARDTEKPALIESFTALIWVTNAPGFEDVIEEWIGWREDVSLGAVSHGRQFMFTRTYPPLVELWKAAARRPEVMLGVLDEEGTYMPGLIPLISILSRHPQFDQLNQILAFGELSGLIQDEVAEMAAKRGMRACSVELVENRVRAWDKTRAKGQE